MVGAQDAQVSIERIRKVMHAFQGEVADRPSRVPSSRKLWTALLALDGYLVGQATTAPSVPALGRDLCQRTIPSRAWQLLPDPQT